MSQSASMIAFAAQINVSLGTMSAWVEHYPEFAEAKNIAFARYQSWWESQARAGLFDETISEGVAWLSRTTAG